MHPVVWWGERWAFFYSLRLVFYWCIFLRFLMANVHLKLSMAVLLALFFPLNQEDSTIACFTSCEIVMQLYRFLPS